MRDVDPTRLQALEAAARALAAELADGLGARVPGTGFALLVFSVDGPEATWITNVDRDALVAVLREFLAKADAGHLEPLERPPGGGE